MTEKQRDENYVKKLVKAYFEKIGAYSFPIPANGMGVSGIPDRIAVYRGLFIGVECKRPGRRGEKSRGCSALQVKSLRAIVDHDGLAWVVDSQEDLDKLDAELRRVGVVGGVCNLDLDYWVTKK